MILSHIDVLNRLFLSEIWDGDHIPNFWANPLLFWYVMSKLKYKKTRALLFEYYMPTNADITYKINGADKME